jgi:hypothetical protein
MPAVRAFALTISKSKGVVFRGENSNGKNIQS